MKEQQTINRELRVIKVGEWVNTIGPDITIKGDQSLKEYARSMFRKYIDAYKPQQGFEYFFNSQFGLPSPIIRIDMPLVTQDVQEGQGFFEIEARPAGLGLDSLLFEAHKEQFQNYVHDLQEFLGKKLAVKVFPYVRQSRHDPGAEKKVFAEMAGIDFFGPKEFPNTLEDYLFFTYGNSGDPALLKEFESRSLFPVRDDGNKDYLIDMNRAKVANVVDVSRKMNLGAAFVLKPRKGMWAQDVYVYPGEAKSKQNGFALSDEIREVIEAGSIEDFLLQSFIRPGYISLEGQDYYAMARIYGLADIASRSYEPVHGIYIARRNIKLHGTSDAITGQLLFV